jgi:hypothetical protein
LIFIVLSPAHEISANRKKEAAPTFNLRFRALSIAGHPYAMRLKPASDALKKHFLAGNPLRDFALPVYRKRRCLRRPSRSLLFRTATGGQ